MTDDRFDRDSWERRWSQALGDHPDKVASRPPNAHLLAEVGDLEPGLALDAGCGHGAEAIWLAASGWRVTAVDFSVTALDHARSTAQAVGEDVAERIEWVEGDLGSWTPPSRRFDLVSCLYVHVAGSVGEMVTRLAAGVAPGGTLFMVGHLPVDPATGAADARCGTGPSDRRRRRRGSRLARLADHRRRGTTPRRGRRRCRCGGAGGPPDLAIRCDTSDATRRLLSGWDEWREPGLSPPGRPAWRCLTHGGGWRYRNLALVWFLQEIDHAPSPSVAETLTRGRSLACVDVCLHRVGGRNLGGERGAPRSRRRSSTRWSWPSRSTAALAVGQPLVPVRRRLEPPFRCFAAYRTPRCRSAPWATPPQAGSSLPWATHTSGSGLRRSTSWASGVASR